MDISIAMCTYNGDRFLTEQLSSILEQTKPPCEVVVCDDGSSDTTPHLLQEFAARAPFPVVLVRNPSTLGSTRNFAQAIGLCRGQAIALCDQDDRWAAHKLHSVDQVLESEPETGAVFSNAFLLNENSEVLSDSLWERRRFTPRLQARFEQNNAAQLLKYNPATGATFVFRSRYVPQVMPIPVEWVHDAWIALLIAIQSRIRMLPEKLTGYRLHAAQQIGMKRIPLSDELLIRRWTALETKLRTAPATASIDANIWRSVHKRLHFLQARSALKQRGLAGRMIAASRGLPGYFHFARGLFSYALDVAGARTGRVEP